MSLPALRGATWRTTRAVRQKRPTARTRPIPTRPSTPTRTGTAGGVTVTPTGMPTLLSSRAGSSSPAVSAGAVSITADSGAATSRLPAPRSAAVPAAGPAATAVPAVGPAATAVADLTATPGAD